MSMRDHLNKGIRDHLNTSMRDHLNMCTREGHEGPLELEGLPLEC